MPSVLITGASRGLGAEFARQYAELGWTVFALVRNDAPKIPGIHPIIADITDKGSYDIALSAVSEKAEFLDILIHNAGVFAPGESDITTIDSEAMLRVFHVNAVAPMALTRALQPLLHEGSKVLGLTSGSGIMNKNSLSPGGQYSYGASKAAFHHLLRRLHFDLSPQGIIVCGMAPGYVLTDMTRSNQSPPSLMPEVSVAGMIRTAEQLTLAESGKFYSHDGKMCEWML